MSSDGTTLNTTGVNTPPVTPQGQGDIVNQRTGYESSLSNWAGPYVTEMLGRGQALANTPYEAYTGPLTAGPSQLQQQAFQGVANLTVPTEQMGAFTPQSFTQTGTAETYMNPFIQQSLQPQLDELRRQTEIARVNQAGALTRAGAYGGGRQAVMDAELDRGYLDRAAGVTGAAYSDAFNRAQAQFNTEQDRARQAQELANTFGLSALARQADFGSQQRAIEGQGIAADKAQFEEELAFPYKQTQYMQSLLQGLPLKSQDYTYATPSQLQGTLMDIPGITGLYNTLFGGGASGGASSGGIGSLLSSVFSPAISQGVDYVGDAIGSLFSSNDTGGFNQDATNYTNNYFGGLYGIDDLFNPF